VLEADNIPDQDASTSDVELGDENAIVADIEGGEHARSSCLFDGVEILGAEMTEGEDLGCSEKHTRKSLPFRGRTAKSRKQPREADDEAHGYGMLEVCELVPWRTDNTVASIFKEREVV